MQYITLAMIVLTAALLWWHRLGMVRVLEVSARSGHAVEARLYAEDPAHGFLPQAGTATLVRWPDRARTELRAKQAEASSRNGVPPVSRSARTTSRGGSC